MNLQELIGSRGIARQQNGRVATRRYQRWNRRFSRCDAVGATNRSTANHHHESGRTEPLSAVTGAWPRYIPDYVVDIHHPQPAPPNPLARVQAMARARGIPLQVARRYLTTRPSVARVARSWQHSRRGSLLWLPAAPPCTLVSPVWEQNQGCGATPSNPTKCRGAGVITRASAPYPIARCPLRYGAIE